MIILILILATILRLAGLNQSFWLDEAVQAVISSKPLSQINFGADFQPPLFYILSHFWLKLGIKSEWFLRLPNVIFGVMTIYLTYYFIKKLFDKKVGLLACLFLATAPFHIYYSQEFRMYSLLTLLVLLSWIFLWERRWILYGVTILAAVFTHYFAFFAILAQFIFIFIYDRKNASRFTLHASLFLSPFLLWLPTVYKQMETAQSLISLWPKWGNVLGVSFYKFIPLVFAKLTVGATSPNKLIYIPSVALTGIIFFSAFLKLINFRLSAKYSQPSRLRILSVGAKNGLLMIFFFIPLFISWILGLWISVNTPHRLVFILPAFYGILAFGLTKIKTQKIRIILIAMILIFNISFSIYYLFNPKNHRENWREAVAETDKRVGENGVILVEFQGPFAPMVWYSKKPEKYIGGLAFNNLDQRSIALWTKQSTINNIILYTYLFEIFDPERKVEVYLNKNDFFLREEKDFRGVGIIKYYSK